MSQDTATAETFGEPSEYYLFEQEREEALQRAEEEDRAAAVHDASPRPLAVVVRR